MARLIAIDYGLKRVGLAIADPLKIIASPYQTVSTPELEDFLLSFDQKEVIEAFVVGMPKNLKNESTQATEMVENFVKQLKTTFPEIPVHLVDERFTSKMAVDAMIAGGAKKKDRRIKENVDKISAAIILQSFLDFKVST
ncbi:MAG: Holliday junction resolvase RuvX [Bacteroidetes bacterium]|nr:Holliday junction resolvase RuvX [Bacteroidota bacterium]